MTALKIIGIILLVFLLIGFLRLGAVVSFGEELRVKIRVGAIMLTIIPGKKKKKKEKPEKAEEEKPKEEKEGKKKGKKSSFPKPSLEDIIDLIETSLSALGAMLRRACSRVRIDPMDATLVLGGDDPALIASLYGIASSAMFSLMPKAEERFYIPDPSLHLRMDFEAEGTTGEGTIGVSLRVCDLFAIMFTLIIPLFKWFLRFKKAHRHDDSESKHAVAAKTEEKLTETEDNIA